MLGPADDVVADVERYADAGTTKLLLTTYDTAVDSQVEQIERFGDRVLPSF